VSSLPAERRKTFLGAVGLLALFAAGIVLALSWLLPFPEMVLGTAWLVALAAMAVVIGSAFRTARAAGAGLLAAVGKSLRALGRFVFWFF
jgi:hypothetical protein